MATKKPKKQRTAPSLADMVVLLDDRLVSFLTLGDIRELIQTCPQSVSPEARDSVATALIRRECTELDVHLGTECYKNWCQLVPATIDGVNHALYCDCDQSEWDEYADFPYRVKVPKILPLPSLFDARPRLLDAMHLIREGIIQHCGSVFQLMCLDNNDGVRFGTFQPVMVSLTTALEAQLEAQLPPQPQHLLNMVEVDHTQQRGSHHDEGIEEDDDDDDDDEDDVDEEEYEDEDDFFDGERRTASERRRLRAIRRENERLEHLRCLERVRRLRKAAAAAKLQPIDTDNVEELKRLLNNMEVGFGTRFFTSKENQRRRAVGIVEDHWKKIEVDLDTDTTTCKFCKRKSNPLLRQHCEAVFQPLKKYMIRHLKHVRYVRPPRNWRLGRGIARWFLDLIAGFTADGVLCGVYLTDVVNPDRELYGDDLAEGGIDMELDKNPKKLIERPERYIGGFYYRG